MSRAHILTDKLYGAAFIQPAHKAQAECRILKQRAIHTGKAPEGAIDPHLAAERTENAQFAGWGIVMRLRCKAQPNQSLLLAFVLKVEGIGGGAEQLADLIFIGLFAF